MKIINHLFFFCTTTATEYALEIGPLDSMVFVTQTPRGISLLLL
jgi:hypothetical protein